MYHISQQKSTFCNISLRQNYVNEGVFIGTSGKNENLSIGRESNEKGGVTNEEPGMAAVFPESFPAARLHDREDLFCKIFDICPPWADLCGGFAQNE